MNGVPCAVFAPGHEAVVDRRAGRVLRRQVAPLAAGPGLVEDRVDDEPSRVNVRSVPSVFVVRTDRLRVPIVRRSDLMGRSVGPLYP